MKKNCVLLCMVALCICYASQGLPAAAEKDYESNDEYELDIYYKDSFYLSHEKECKQSGASYFAEEEVTCYKNPESSKTLSPIEKGTYISIGYIYQADFETWGSINFITNKDAPLLPKEGWVKIEDLKFSEDATSFFWEYIKDMGKMERDALTKILEEVQGNLKKEIVMWSYPCSGKIVGKMSKEEYPSSKIFQTPRNIYCDYEKRYWWICPNDKKVGGKPYCAICLSDPENDQIGKEITLTKPYTGGKYGRWLVVIPIGIVICILMVGVIIFRVRRRLRIKKMAEDV